MTPNLPHLSLKPIPATWDPGLEPAQWPWQEIPALSPFIRADGSGPAQQQTVTRVCYDEDGLWVRFDCEDDDIWATYTQRDDPIYDEEVVEVFLAAGAADPIRYFEFEVSPTGVLFDARVYNPTGDRADMEVDVAWNCPGIRWQTGRDDVNHHWWAILAIPWRSVAPAEAELPQTWRANFYRIERPRPDRSDQEVEFSCWSPTQTDPPDYHKPARFGRIELT